MPDVVFPALGLDILAFALRIVSVEWKIFLAYCRHVLPHLLERPISREARLDLGEDAQTIKSCGLELFNGDFFYGRFIVATSWATCMSSVQ